MEYKIGQIFEIDGIWYQFVKDDGNGCKNCVFYYSKIKRAIPDEDVRCSKWLREDGNNGHFVRLLPLGKVYEQGGDKWQQYKCIEKPNTEDKRVYIADTDSEVGLIVSIRLTSSSDKERKIGEIFEYNGEWYQCVEEIGCNGCAFDTIQCSEMDDIIGQCTSGLRHDDKSVVFKKLEKVGEPFIIEGILYQHYKVSDIDNVCGGSFWCVHNYKAKTLTIEIKQNKEEDMKTVRISKDDLNFLVNKIRYGILPKHTTYDEITDEISSLFSVDDTKHSNSEKIGKNLKPFDLQAAKSGKPVCTRDGRKARIICFDSKNDPQRPIIALVENNSNELLYEYTIKGKDRFSHISTTGTSDLMMLPEKKEGWTNVSKFKIYDSEEEALSHKTDDIISTIKVEWYE